MAALAMGRERFNAALYVLVRFGFVMLIEPGRASKPPLFEWPKAAVESDGLSGSLFRVGLRAQATPLRPRHRCPW
jgi:hypothetical protein